jgi:glutamyl-tRNA reductase
VRSETGISEGAVSVGYAGVELAKKIFKSLEELTVLVIGAGQTGELTARHLLGNGVKRLFIANRTYETAHALAKSLGGKAIYLEEIKQDLANADIVIAAVAGGQTIVDAKTTAQTMKARGNAPLFFIDLSVPRAIDVNIRDIYNVFLYDVDDLQGVIEINLAKRQKELKKAEKIIEEEAGQFMRRHRERRAAPTIRELSNLFEEIRLGELAKHKHRLPAEQLAEIDAITKAIVNKILHMPITTVKNAAAKEEKKGLIQSIREIFKLEEENG